MTTFSSFAVKALPALVLLGLAGCQPDIDGPSANPGPLDFTSYVAVGNSLTAGYSDSGLYNEAQATSYPALLAQQFGATGKGPASFVQPAFSAGKPDGSGYIKLRVINGALTPVQPAKANGYLGERLDTTGVTLPGGKQLGAYSGVQPDNLGIPGISVLSSLTALTGGLAPPYGVINPFYERLLTQAEKSSKDYVTYVGQKNPTFFTCWMGNNDVLTYASNGGVVPPPTVNPFGGLTDTTRFGIGYRAILQTISKNGAVKGAVANIPAVANVPYFRTVTVAAVAAAFKAANAASPGVFIQTSSTTTPVRLATAADLLTLTAQAVVATGAGSTPTNPLPNQYVLDADEQAAVLARTTQLNTIIAKTALRFKVPVVDMNAFFTSIGTTGVVANSVNNTAIFASGNLFSLDGVHPTPRGYALIANEWIRVINSYYSASIPPVNPTNYRGVLFP